jgi:hypothetical protein
MQQQRAHNAENSGIGAYPDGQRENCGHGKSRAFAKSPQGITEIAH